MAKLPDIQSMGARPIPSTQGVSQYRMPATADIGQGVSALGEAFVKVKQYDDTLRAEDAFNRLQKRKLELTTGEQGFSQIKSSGVVDRPVYKEYSELFDKTVNEITSNLQNDQQRNMFRQRAEVSKLQFGNDLTNHIQREKQVYSRQVFDGGLAVELENAGQHWTEPGSVNLSIERTNRLIDQQSELEGWPFAITKAKKQVAESNIHQNVINQAIATDNPEYAKEWYRKNKKKIESTEHPRIEKLLDQSSLKVLAQEVTDDIFSRGLTQDQAVKEVRRKYKGDEENAIISSVRDRFNEEENFKTQKEADAGDAAWKIYSETLDFDQIPLTTLRKMNGKDRESLRAYAEKEKAGESVKTNYAVYYELIQMAEERPAEFRKLNMLKFLPHLSEKHRDQLIKLQTDRTEIDYVATQAQLAKRGAIRAGLDPKAEGKDNDDGRAISAFYDNLNRKTTAFQETKGRKPDDKELNQIIDDMLIDRVFVEEWGRDPEKPLTTLTPEELKEAYVIIEKQEVKVSEIPDKERTEITLKLIKAGQRVTEENIARRWLILTGKL